MHIREAIKIDPHRRVGLAQEAIQKGHTACPAAGLCSSGILCRIEDRLLEPVGEPTSIIAFCTDSDGYTECSSWRTAHDEGNDQKQYVSKLRKADAKQLDQDAETLERFGVK